MKKFIIITLVFIFRVITPALIYHFATLPPKETSGTIVGEVFYIKYSKADVYDTCRIYIKPTVNTNNAPLMCLIVNTETVTESNFVGAMTEIPEIQIGEVVEIEYVTQNNKQSQPLAKSIKSSNAQTDMSSWTTLTMNDNYAPLHSQDRPEDFGKVVYVSKITSPREGYLVYLDDAKYGSPLNLSCYWIDDTIKSRDDALFALLEQEATGYYIDISPLYTHPFNEIASFHALFAFLKDK